MKIKRVIAFLTLTLLTTVVLAACTDDEEPGTSVIDWNNSEQCAEQFVTALLNGDYTIAAAGFDDEMTRALGVPGLKRAWEDTANTTGDFVRFIGTETEPNDNYGIYIVISQHENLGISSRVVFSQDGKIAGLFFSFVENP